MAHPIVTITGMKEVDKELATIEPKLQRKAIRRAADESARLVAAEAIAHAPSDSGEGKIEASVKRRAMRRSRSRMGRSVHAGDIFEPGTDQPFYAAFVELGTRQRSTKSGHYVGRIDVKETQTPFLRPALYDQEHQIRRFFISQLMQGIRELRIFGKLSRRKATKLI